MFIHGHFHIVEFDLHAVEQGVVVDGAGGDLIQGVEHFDDAVQNSLGQHQTQIAGGRVQSGGDEGFRNAFGGRPLPTDQVAEALDDDAAAQHIA